MFTKIMIPVDLRHVDRMEKALTIAAGLARQYGAEAHITGVTVSTPTEVARTPKAYADKLAAFAAETSETHGVTFTPHAEISHDASIDLDDILSRTADKIGADLIVMASHVPGFADRFMSSNAGYLASHAHISVFVVR
ncbi:universal stress protein [Sulfitobacter aestuarii]|uniref:Universal stress protein n=1 Tax=Sulfitobacter aestuarii TaxID=2161676 RepID=A0ABW5U9E9_9RHOB